VDGNSWFVSTLSEESIVDVHGVVVVNHIETSGEIIELDIKLTLRDIKSWCASTGNGTVDDWSWVGVISVVELDSRDCGNSGNNAKEFHVNFIIN